MTPSQQIEIADLPPEWREAFTVTDAPTDDWRYELGLQVALALQRGDQNIFSNLSRQFECTLITQALKHTDGRRIEAATLLGMGRNTMTRKIQEFGLDK
jgi:two-component system nitrogen regulation response regulator GlnG